MQFQQRKSQSESEKISLKIFDIIEADNKSFDYAKNKNLLTESEFDIKFDEKIHYYRSINQKPEKPFMYKISDWKEVQSSN